jgi:hypothetical protein
MSLLLLLGGAAPTFADTVEELVNTAPVPAHGYQFDRDAVAGVWRFALELADTAAGTEITWHDMTQFYAGDSYQRGADQYGGKYRAAVAQVQVQTDDDLLAPWGDGQDTSSIFGVNVELDAGLLMRFGLFRVVAGVTVEWEPLWTGRVETWGDASAARGQIRTHIITVTDTIADLANVPTTIEQNDVPPDEWMNENLEDASWLYGVDYYLDTDVGMLQDLTAVNAINRMDMATDPWGLVWRSRRNGRLLVYPAPWDTTQSAVWPNPLLDVYPGGLVFSFSPDFTEIEYIDDDDQQSFGIQRTSLGVLNWFVVTSAVGPTEYLADDPVSIQRYGQRPFVASWFGSGSQEVVDDLLAARAYSSSQALPLRTTLDHEGFWSALAIVDHLDPVTVIHQTQPEGPVVTATGVIRNVTEDRTIRGEQEGVTLLTWQSTVQIDLDSTETTPALLPVEDLAVVAMNTPLFGGPSSAEFSWTNPTQPDVTPTEVQLRVLGRSLIWFPESYPGVGADGTTIGWLSAATTYTLQVRLIRRVNGVITHVSPIREIEFTTPAVIIPTPVPDGEDTDVTVGEPPDFDPEDCELEVELQENDGTGWVTIETYEQSDLEQNEDGTWSLITPVPNSTFQPDAIYRFRSREICGTVVGDWFTGTTFDPPEDWTDPCVEPPQLSVAPWDDAELIVYVPKVCQGDDIVEAVSGITGVHGDAFAGFVQFVGEADRLALLAIPNPEWVDTPGGILAYGECPQITGVTGDKTIGVTVNVDEVADCVLFECAGMQLQCVEVTATTWRAAVVVYLVGSTVTLPTTAILDDNTDYEIFASFELATGDIKIYVNGVEDNSVGGTDNVPTINVLPIWRVGAPPESWITDCAVWSRVVVPAPPPFTPPDISNLWGWWDASDTGTIADTGGQVTQWDDKSGNNRDLTTGASAAVVTGTRSQNSLNVIDFNVGQLAASANVGIPDPVTMFVVYVQDTTPGSPFIRSIVYAKGAGGEAGLRTTSTAPELVQQVGGTVVLTGSAITNGTWTMLSAKSDPGGAGSTLTLRVDGSLVDTDTGTGGFASSSTTLRIGNYDGGSNRTLDGAVAEVIIYNAVLSAGDITDVETYLNDKWGI